MRLPIRVAQAVRLRRLMQPEQHILVALSGGPDSVALLHCLLEFARKRDLRFKLSAAHLNHGLRGKDSDADEEFCRKLCVRKKIPLWRAFVDTPKLMASLKRSMEETARIARRNFLSLAAAHSGAACVAIAHHADDRIETVLYRLCRGTGLAGLQGIGWTGPLRLEREPDVSGWLIWHPESPTGKGADCQAAQKASEITVVRPLLGCTRAEVLAYLRSKRQRYCTDETNFDSHIPRNALRNQILPLLEKKVHPGTRAALWRLAEEAEVHAKKRAWSREWLSAFTGLARRGRLELPVPNSGILPSTEEISDTLNVLGALHGLEGGSFSLRHVQALRGLFVPQSGPKHLDLPGGLAADRRGKVVAIS
jgi:tRNA(Ile)-lysidine synthase